MSVLFLVVSVVGLAAAWNAVRTQPGRFGPLWFPALFSGELAPFQAAAQAGLAAGFAAAGWAGGWTGVSGLAATGVSIALLGVNQWRALGTREVVASAAAAATGAPVRLPPVRVGRLLRPYPAPPRSVVAERGLAYGPDPAHRFDRFSRRDPVGPGPVLVEVHGGGWTGGRRDQQARPLMHRMAAAGWVVYSISYRLSPRATFPEHLVDVKRAIAWVRDNGAADGADPGFVAITGGSAGGQLAALDALTAGDPHYQPGFEEADTSVTACVPVYGVHDLLDDAGRPKWPYLATYVLKAGPDEDPDLWVAASPVRTVRAERPPFLIVHGSADTLVPPADSRRLAEALRDAGSAPVGLAEVPGATHGFDAVHSLRTERVVDGVEAVLNTLWERERERRSGS
jgi:acetyl esterase/lipase